VLERSTSIYYPVRLDAVIEQIRERPGRYAITAIPCFAKALRLAARRDSVLAERIVCIVGIVCGQLKSKYYVEYLARRAGVTPPVRDVCFRRKVQGERADNYAFEATYHDAEGRLRTAAVRNRAIGANWGMGYFKPKACDYCDDVFAETADVALMDAWLPQFVTDGEGTSLAIVRSEAVQEAFARGAQVGELRLVSVSESDLVASQRGGLNHRRVGLRYRLSLAGGRWVPQKRVKATGRLHWSFRLDQRLRILLRAASSAAMRWQLRSRGMRSFDTVMTPLQILYKTSARIKDRCKASSGGTGTAAPFELDGRTDR
jgi:coenzyme F420-reducing hydrogenase beta subunit